MITLKFTSAQIRNIIQSNSTDRLASLLLDRLIGNPASIASLLVSHLRQNGVKMPPVEANKVWWIKELREWSRNNPDILALFEPRHPNSGGPDVLGLAEAKQWIEKLENAAAINALL